MGVLNEKRCKITHNAGFFSCCSVKLTKIVEFINLNKKLPDSVDSSAQLYHHNCELLFIPVNIYISISNILSIMACG